MILALGLSSAHAHEAHSDSLSHDCIACMVVSGLDDADTPVSISFPDGEAKLDVLPQASRELTHCETVTVKARGPPAHI